MKRAMTERRARWWLAGLWLSGWVALALVLFGQNLGNRYGERGTEAWGWYLPMVTPTAMLIVGVLVAEYRAGARRGSRKVGGPMFALVMGLSAAYLLVVALTILLPPLLSQVTPLEAMARSSLLLGPFQGLVAAALGAFFSAKP